MLPLFRKVSDSLYRSSAPKSDDIVWLKKKLGIDRVISLDDVSGKKIALTCKLLKIEHILLPIDYKKSSLIHMLSSFDKLFEGEGKSKKTLVHCLHGKDRCGLFIALYRTRIENWKPKKAIKEADSMGFCSGLAPEMTKLFHSLILNSPKEEKESDEMDVIDFSYAPFYEHRDILPYNETQKQFEQIFDLDPEHNLNHGYGVQTGTNIGTGIPGAGFTFPGIYPAY